MIGHDFPDDVVHRVTITAEIPSSGPGIEIVAAELLLDLVQRFGYQAIVPIGIRLDISTLTLPPSTL